MHFLDRTTVPRPACLVDPPADREYGDLTGAQKLEIRNALLNLQKNRCAYCERRTGEERNDGHIEHFRTQTGHPGLTMDWNNMFWSCIDEKCCGKHKDKCLKAAGPQRTFDPNDIIHPSTENPDDFLLFVADGTVRPIDGLDEQNTRRATETLRVFQVTDYAMLRKAREDAVRPYIGALEVLCRAGAELLREYVEGELSGLDSVPHPTAIRHFFRDFAPYEQPPDQISAQAH